MSRTTQYTDLSSLRAAIVRDYDALPQRLQQLGKFILDNPDLIALETLTNIAARSNTHPSTIVRFAKCFGFRGASDMQRVFKDDIVNGDGRHSYVSRLQGYQNSHRDDLGVDPGALLGEFITATTGALHDLAVCTPAEMLSRAIKCMTTAETIYVVGFGRAIAISAYLYYALGQIGRKCVFIDGIAGIQQSQVSLISEKDLLIASSFQPYAPETSQIAKIVAANGADIVAITDSDLSPIIDHAKAHFVLREDGVHSFRSLATPLCLAQAIVTAAMLSKSQH